MTTLNLPSQTVQVVQEEIPCIALNSRRFLIYLNQVPEEAKLELAYVRNGVKAIAEGIWHFENEAYSLVGKIFQLLPHPRNLSPIQPRLQKSTFQKIQDILNESSSIFVNGQLLQQQLSPVVAESAVGQNSLDWIPAPGYKFINYLSPPCALRFQKRTLFSNEVAVELVFELTHRLTLPPDDPAHQNNILLQLSLCNKVGNLGFGQNTCIQDQSSPSNFQITWVKVNGALSSLIRQAKSHLNLDLSAYSAVSAAKNVVQILANCAQDYEVIAAIAELRKFKTEEWLTELYEWPRFTMEQTKQMLKDELFGATDPVLAVRRQAAASKLPPSFLKCPIWGTAISTPCRSTKCKHSACFDGWNFLKNTAVLRSHSLQLAPTCPICQTKIRFEDLRIDSYFTALLKEVGLVQLKHSSFYVVIQRKSGDFSVVDERKERKLRKFIAELFDEPRPPRLPKLIKVKRRVEQTNRRQVDSAANLTPGGSGHISRARSMVGVRGMVTRSMTARIRRFRLSESYVAVNAPPLAVQEMQRDEMPAARQIRIPAKSKESQPPAPAIAGPGPSTSTAVAKQNKPSTKPKPKAKKSVTVRTRTKEPKNPGAARAEKSAKIQVVRREPKVRLSVLKAQVEYERLG